jgi:separase
MGCSSGKLTLRGDFEPSGSVFSYLMAGSSAAVANLWDVTDGDIDRFSKRVLQQWLQSESSDDTDSGEESGGSGKAVGHLPRSSAQVQFEVPPADKCISAVVAAGRTACILPFLIGAAPVCYGVPTGFV